MTRPADPSDVASGSPGTSSWANSVTDAIQAILADIYGVSALTIPWAALSGVPSTFTPAAHTHADATHGGTIAYGVLTGIPSTFTPAAHTHADATHGGTIAYSVLTGIPSTFAPAVHAHTSAPTGGTIAYSAITGTPTIPTAASLLAPTTYNTPATGTTRRIYVGTSTPTGASDGDVWIKG